MHGRLKMAATSVVRFMTRCIFLFVLVIAVCGGSKLNVPKLLLPYNSQVATNFTLEVSDGCFVWRSSRPEVVSVRPVGTADSSACSQTAVVTSASTVPTRRTAIITAEDSVTSQQLRCDVIVDEIKQIHIETTTKELFLDDSPEEFVIRASNDKDDMFSSLDGMIFEWSLISDKESVEQAANVLRLLKFSESSYTAFPHIKTLEDQGKRGDRILMKGLQTGAAIISVRPADPVYKHLSGDNVRVLVVANLQLTPSVVYLLPHATVTYKVELLKQGKAHAVEMPSKQYYLDLENASIASLDSRTSTVTALEFGFTELKLKDQTLQPSDTFREPSAGVYVVSPAYLEFTVYPDPDWLLETKQTYVVHVCVFDGADRKIYPSKNLHVAATFPEHHFRVLSVSANGTYYVVETLRKGFTNLFAQLKSVTMSNRKEFMFDKPVEGTQSVEIYDPILLVPETVIIPWESSRNKVHFQFKVSGGSGNYSWMSSNPSAAHISSSGLVTVGSTTGSVVVTASDVRNSAHFDASQVFVIPPSGLAFLPSKVEAEISSHLKLPIALFGQLDDRNVTFDKCHMLTWDIRLSDRNIFRKVSVEESLTEGACADLVLEAVSVGHVEVTVAYGQDAARVHMQASQVIAAYTPLKPFRPKEVAVVTLGSSVEIIFEGGPHPWVLDASGFYQTSSFENKELVAVSEPYFSDASKHRHTVIVKCSNFGEQVMKLEVGNKPTAKNPYPASSLAKLIFACETPKGLQLFPVIEHSTTMPPCPVSSEYDDPVPVPIWTNVKMLAVVTDRLGRKFSNFSSLIINWYLSDENLAKFLDDSNDMEHGRQLKDQLGKGSRWIALAGESSFLTVTVHISKYDGHMDGSWFSNTPVDPAITKSRTLHLVDYPVFSPSEVIIFNHPDIETSLDILGGSGYFNISQSERAANIAKIISDIDHPSNISVMPLSEGSVTLTVVDLCLSPAKSSTASIFVSDIAQIELQVVDKVELHREVKAAVRVLDGNGLPIENSFFSLMDIQLVSRSDIVSIYPSVTTDKIDRVTAVYQIRGDSLGRAYLQASTVAKNGNRISSIVREIQVFPPLRLRPKNITIIPGTFFQVMAFGGPQPESSIEFKMKNETVATVSNDGLISALELGSTQIVAMATGLDASNSSRVVFSQDFAVVEVVEMTGVRIVVPLKRIQAGNKMPVYAVGLNENVTPFSFANVAPPLEFRWTIANEQVALVRPVYHESGIDMSYEGNFAVRFYALSSGHVTLNLVVSSPYSKMSAMTDSVVIRVFDRLSFLSPLIFDGTILMMPNTELHVKTNRDGSNVQLSYAVVQPDVGQQAVISVNQNGLVTSGGFPGQSHLQISAQEEFGVNHTMVVLVKVKPLSYIMINSETVIHSKFPGVSSFPVGTTINFLVSLHDDIGEKFYATQSNIRFQLNKYDQIQMLYGKTNNSLAARANSPGFTVLKVYEKLNPLITDYVGIPIESAIQPSRAQVVLGSAVCFSSNLLTREGHAGEWLNSGDEVTIDRSSGIVLANHVGSSYVTYNVSYVVTQTNLKVVPITKVIIQETESVKFLTNFGEKSRSGPSFQVALENTDQHLSAGLHGANCSIRSSALQKMNFVPFACDMTFTKTDLQLEISDILNIEPFFDRLTGKHSCRVSTVSDPALLQQVASIETSIEVLATVFAQDSQVEVTSEKLVLPFYPMFFIQNPEAALTVSQSVANIRIVATEDVLNGIQIISGDESLVRVRVHQRSSSVNQDVTKFPIELQLTTHMWNVTPTVVNLTVTCVLTGQSEVVVVNLLRNDQADMSWGHLLSALLHKYSNFFFVIICLTATVSCMIIAYQLVYGQRYHYSGDVPNSPAFLSSPQSPFTPAYQSKKSTSPALWSVDRSPYSNGRRSVSPRSSSQRS